MTTSSARFPALESLLAQAAGRDASAAAPLAGAFVAHVGQEQACRCLELSLRASAAGLRGGRALLERVDASVLDEAGLLLGLLPGSALRAVAARAPRHGAALLVGWDVGGGRAVLKAYLSAVDLGEAARREAARAALRDLGQPAALPPGPAPTIVGVNETHGGGPEIKLYMEYPSAETAAAAQGGRALALAARICGAGRAAGALRVLQARGGRWAPRAFVTGVAGGAALAEADPVAAALLVETGVAAAAYARLAPRAPARLRYVSVPLRGPLAYTLYLRPELPGAASLEPPRGEEQRGCDRAFRCGALDVVVSVEPAPPEAPAYARIGPLRLTYRLRAGRPPAAELDVLMRWAVDRLRSRGGDVRAAARALAAAPPPPWRRAPL